MASRALGAFFWRACRPLPKGDGGLRERPARELRRRIFSLSGQRASRQDMREVDKRRLSMK